MTIYALSSGPGISGVAVIRVSGKNNNYNKFKSQNIKNFFRPNIDQQTPQKNKFF